MRMQPHQRHCSPRVPGNLPIALALLSCFSALGIVVAGLGVYATATLMSAARTRETGIRLAIGRVRSRLAG